jgi:hypothetical protein
MNETRRKVKPSKGPFDVTRKISLAPTATEKLQNAVQQFTAIEPIINAHVDRLKPHRRTAILGYRSACLE